MTRALEEVLAMACKDKNIYVINYLISKGVNRSKEVENAAERNDEELLGVLFPNYDRCSDNWDLHKWIIRGASRGNQLSLLQSQCTLCVSDQYSFPVQEALREAVINNHEKIFDDILQRFLHIGPFGSKDKTRVGVDLLKLAIQYGNNNKIKQKILDLLGMPPIVENSPITIKSFDVIEHFNGDILYKVESSESGGGIYYPIESIRAIEEVISMETLLHIACESGSLKWVDYFCTYSATIPYICLSTCMKLYMNIDPQLHSQKEKEVFDIFAYLLQSIIKRGDLEQEQEQVRIYGYHRRTITLVEYLDNALVSNEVLPLIGYVLKHTTLCPDIWGSLTIKATGWLLNHNCIDQKHKDYEDDLCTHIKNRQKRAEKVHEVYQFIFPKDVINELCLYLSYEPSDWLKGDAVFFDDSWY
jgi:hypothetical protein